MVCAESVAGLNQVCFDINLDTDNILILALSRIRVTVCITQR